MSFWQWQRIADHRLCGRVGEDIDRTKFFKWPRFGKWTEARENDLFARPRSTQHVAARFAALYGIESPHRLILIVKTSLTHAMQEFDGERNDLHGHGSSSVFVIHNVPLRPC